MIRPLAAALQKLGSLLKAPQSDPRSSGAALSYASVNVLDPSALARAFAAADRGDITDQAALFELVEEQDAHLFGELAKRRRAVTGLGWQLAAPPDATEAEIARTKELEGMLRAIPRFEDAHYDITDAIGKGFAALEINWRPGKLWLPAPDGDRPALGWVPQRLFKLEKGRLCYLRDGIPEPLAPGRWLVHEHRAKSGYIENAALFRVLAWCYAYKAYSVRDMQRFLEVYGLPLRLGKYPAGLGDKERDALLRAVRNIGSDGAGVVPDTMQIEFVQASKAGTVDDFLSAIAYWERKQSVAILGGTLTSQADGKTSTNALGEVHNQVRREIMLHDAGQVAPTLTAQLVRPIATINGLFRPERCPSFAYLTEEEIDQKKLAEVLKAAADIGMRVDVEWAHKAMQIPIAAEDAEILRAPAPSGGTGGMPVPEQPEADLRRELAALARDGRRLDDPAALSTERLQADASPQIGQWLDAIEAMLGGAGSLEEFREMLLAAYPSLGDDPLVETLADGFAALELRGISDVIDEAGA
jgi:phage gp29-like protein